MNEEQHDFLNKKEDCLNDESSSLSQKIWTKLDESKIKPLPKWRWTAEEIFNWLLFILSVLLGAISFSVILLELFSADWNLYTHVTDSFAEYLFGILPYFWILFLIAMLFLAYYRFFHTKSAYRYSGLRVLIYNIFFSILLGIILYFVNMSSFVYDLTSNIIPQPDIYMINKYDLWRLPEKGFLAGRLIAVIDENNGKLIGINETEWIVDFSEARLFDMKNIRLGDMIKLLGEKIDDNTFKAKEIHPWKRNPLPMFGPDGVEKPHLVPLRQN